MTTERSQATIARDNQELENEAAELGTHLLAIYERNAKISGPGGSASTPVTAEFLANAFRERFSAN